MAELNATRTYLERAYYINGEIDSKLDQVASLRETATKATTTLRLNPGGGHDNHSMENVIVKIVDMETEINADIDRLIDMKREISDAIKAVKQVRYRILLEKRYLCFKKWENIAVDMNYSIQRVYQMHDEALNAVKIRVN